MVEEVSVSPLAPSIPVVFIHGSAIHASSWDGWAELFAAAGYPAVAPGWPGEAATVQETRRHPETLRNHGVGALTEHYQAIIADLPATPIVIGHCVGGVIAQRLLGRGFARACIALAPAPFRGVLRFRLTQLRTAATGLGDRGRQTRTWAGTADSYYRRAGNCLSRSESDRLFHAFSIPAAELQLRQLVNTAICRDTAVDRRSERGPLLMIAGSADRTASAAAVYSGYKNERRHTGVTQFTIFDRGHSLSADHGWTEIAGTALNFLSYNGL